MANAAEVRISRTGALLTVDVDDDGLGGAGLHAGSGLRGLVDRVEALGGHLEVGTAVSGGTRVHAEIPCR